MKTTLFAALALILLAVLLAGCSLDDVVQLEAPPAATPAAPNPPVPTAALGQSAGGGEIELPGARINIFAPGPNPMMNTPGSGGHVAGILLGVWHGFIAPITLILSFLNHSVQMYEVHNDGAPYNLGFFLGVVILGGGLLFLRR